MSSRIVKVRCKIARSAFSGERVFIVRLFGGGEDCEYEGLAPTHYFGTEQGNSLSDDQPPRDGEIPGTLAARLIKHEDDVVEVALPDGETVELPSDELIKA